MEENKIFEEGSVIEVGNISKTFNIPLDKNNDLKSKIVNFSSRENGYRKFKALDGVSFSVNKGDFFGIVGRNGSGKSTLLKILAEIYVPDKGHIKVRGSLMPFIELGVGFNDRLSARENVFLNGAMMGFTRKEMKKMYGEIVDFAELHDFMEEKLKNFSSGMKVRLAFSIAIQAKSDILLLDEVLAVGDAAFRDKCNDFFKKQKGKRTIILVTHDMNAVEQYCNKALLLDHGKVKNIGESSEIAVLYNDMFAREKQARLHKENEKEILAGKQEINLKSIRVIQEGRESETIKAYSNFQLDVEIDTTLGYKKPIIGATIINSRSMQMVTASTRFDKKLPELKKGRNTIKFDFENVLTDDDYHIHLKILDSERNDLILLNLPRAYTFTVKGIKRYKTSLIHSDVKISVY